MSLLKKSLSIGAALPGGGWRYNNGFVNLSFS
jgi:hypothetical protein